MNKFQKLIFFTSLMLGLLVFSFNATTKVSAATPALSQSTFNISATSSGSGGQILNCTSAPSISVISGSSWLTAFYPYTGYFGFSTKQNNSNSSRTGKIRIIVSGTTLYVTVNQAGKIPTLSSNTINISSSSSGGNGQIFNCFSTPNISVISGNSWLTAFYPYTGYFGFSTTTNASNVSRTGKIKIDLGDTTLYVTINQAGAVPTLSTYTYNISATSSGSGGQIINCYSTPTITVTSGNSWLSAFIPYAGNFGFSTTRNTTATTRTGTIRIAVGDTTLNVTVNQAGVTPVTPTPTPTPTPSLEYEIDYIYADKRIPSRDLGSTINIQIDPANIWFPNIGIYWNKINKDYYIFETHKNDDNVEVVDLTFISAYDPAMPYGGISFITPTASHLFSDSQAELPENCTSFTRSYILIAADAYDELYNYGDFTIPKDTLFELVDSSNIKSLFTINYVYKKQTEKD